VNNEANQATIVAHSAAIEMKIATKKRGKARIERKNIVQRACTGGSSDIPTRTLASPLISFEVNGGIGAMLVELEVGAPQTAQNFCPSTSSVPHFAQ
jgi:hypothetical protein